MEDLVEEKEAAPEAPEEQESDEQGKIEDLATELGWNGDFKGEGFVDAESYIRKSREIQNTMRDHIKDQKEQLTGLVSSVKELKSHNKRVYKAEVTKLKSELSTLKKEKKEAIEDGDVDKVDELDEQIDGVKEAIKEPGKDQAGNHEFDTWVKSNDWYLKDQEMAGFADSIADQNQGAPFKRIATLVTTKVKEMFPDKFEAVKKATPSPVESATRKTTVTKFTKADLSEGQKSIMKQFVKQGIMTEKQYIQDIAKVEGAA